MKDLLNLVGIWPYKIQIASNSMYSVSALLHCIGNVVLCLSFILRLKLPPRPLGQDPVGAITNLFIYLFYFFFWCEFLQGLPSPESERNAIEVVMQYAIDKLGFPVNKIIIYAWSIGGCFTEQSLSIRTSCLPI